MSHKLYCVICGGDLMKRVERYEGAPAFVWAKELGAMDFSHPADKYEQTVRVWCPDCGLLYATE